MVHKLYILIIELCLTIPAVVLIRVRLDISSIYISRSIRGRREEGKRVGTWKMEEMEKK